MNEILNTILKDTVTLTQFKIRLRVLKNYLLERFFGNKLENEYLIQSDLTWLHSLPQNFYQYFNKDNVYEIFKSLESSLNQLKILSIYLAFEANDQTLLEIGTFARKTFNNSTLLLDIKFDPRLIAGCALVWKGVYRDYSVKFKIEQKKGEILDSFKKFLR